MRSHTTRPLAPFLRVIALLLLATIGRPAAAQSLLNGAFGGGNSGWSNCAIDIFPSITYGGPSLFNNVAAVHAGLGPGLLDDRVLCQNITGFSVGATYSLTLQATRCQLPLTPATVLSLVSIDGGALEAAVTRTGGWAMTTEQFTFTATQPTHTLSITPGQSGLLGMIFDNLSLTMTSALPVELLHFNAASAGDRVVLVWATATEQHNDFFTVERGVDGSTFHPLGEIAGAGESQTTVHYAFHDEAPCAGTAYYRLKQTDTDGTSTYSDVVRIEHGRPDIGVVSGAPGHLQLSGPVVGRTLRIWSVSGALIDTRTITAANIEHVSLTPGQYIITLTDPASGAVHAQRLFLN